MIISIVLVLIWAALMLRSGVAQYQYYQSVRTLEPEIWEKLDSLRFLKIPLVFASPAGSKLLRSVTNKTVVKLARQHRQAGIQSMMSLSHRGVPAQGSPVNVLFRSCSIPGAWLIWSGISGYALFSSHP